MCEPKREKCYVGISACEDARQRDDATLCGTLQPPIGLDIVIADQLKQAQDFGETGARNRLKSFKERGPFVYMIEPMFPPGVEGLLDGLWQVPECDTVLRIKDLGATVSGDSEH